MVKKSLLVLGLCIVALSCAFADKASLVMQVSPFAHQNVAVSNGSFNSTCGYGFGLGFRYEAWKNVNLGVDVDISFYNYKELTSDYEVISVRAVGGYTYHLNDKFFVLGELGVGVEERSIGTDSKMNPGFGVKLAAGCEVSESVKVTVGSALDLAFHKTKAAKSTDFAVRPFVGFMATL